ncbi:MAG: hypothetical protein FWC38_02145 [Proteobacteria bacterium]|nr:hypothetical protein [Pseudomonadota bacterium]
MSYFSTLDGRVLIQGSGIRDQGSGIRDQNGARFIAPRLFSREAAKPCVARISEAPSGSQESEVRDQKNHFTAKSAKKRIERKEKSRHSARREAASQNPYDGDGKQIASPTGKVQR